VTAGYEQQVAAAAAGEREARQRAQQLLEESEHVRSQLQRAEARVAEQELAMQRMVAQFEGALATLQQLGAQYDGLAADAGAAERLRAARIAELEQENEGLRVARAGVQQERDASVAELSAALAEADRGASEAKQQYHRAMMDGAELSEALAGARQEAAAARGRAQAAEEELAGLRGEAAAARGALERESGALARTQGLLEASRLHQEAARRDAQEQERLAAAVR
jgi:septation ring formation regulator EzrA